MSSEVKFQPKQKVNVWIFGRFIEVEIFSLDSRYIYFKDPSFRNIPGMERRLTTRSIKGDTIEITK